MKLIPLFFTPLAVAWTSSTTYRPRILATRCTKRSRTALALASSTSTLPRLSADQLQQLQRNNYVVVENFLPWDHQVELREDIQQLLQADRFATAKIGQDATNTLNENIRVAKTCFIGGDRLSDMPSYARSSLYQVLDQVRQDLAQATETRLDATLTELLYAYYPEGGFYRRHRDALPGSASTLRKYSLLLYLNDGWNVDQDGGVLRMHFDSGGDELPAGEEPNYMDVSPQGGTLVLFRSDAIPHEVLDTRRERSAVVGWYNRPVNVGDLAELGGGMVSTRVILLGVSAALVTVGVMQLLGH